MSDADAPAIDAMKFWNHDALFVVLQLEQELLGEGRSSKELGSVSNHSSPTGSAASSTYGKGAWRVPGSSPAPSRGIDQSPHP